ncbi:MAG: 7-carboxy-7-deazaguanine synthase QueE, partial [Campylobacter sp.]|nr:7-carboxy-7-deazaguanine synthase QueE [Campylobacter sp.]
MKLIEHFLSIQGEGAYAGRLAIFVRFGGCNLRCAGFGVRLKAPNAKELI